jgi:hypothetical protein
MAAAPLFAGAISAVGSDVAEVVPREFLAISRTRTVWLTSADPSV